MKPDSRNSILSLSILILAALACAIPQSTASTPTILPVTPPAIQVSTPEQATQYPSGSASPAIRATSLPKAGEHRISTHRIYGIAGFYDRDTSKEFIPRGVNYAMVVPILGHYEDRLFAVDVYDHDRSLSDFKAIKKAGYNTVRIIFDGCTSGETCIGTPDGQGLNPTYLDNITDLMQVAKETGLFLVLASSEIPELGGYAEIANQGANQYFGTGRNAEYLTTSGILAAQKYWSDLLAGLISRQAPLEIVMGWELQDEQYYDAGEAPFSLDTGKAVPANGKSYDLTDQSAKKALAEDGMRYYIEQVRQTIHEQDPTALVTMGFFAPDAPNPWREGDERLVVATAMLEESELDFFDFQAYPGDGLSMEELAQNFGLSEHITKPVLMGEVGASTWSYPEVSAGAIAVQDWIAASCRYGYSGWLYQAYYPSPAGLIDATWGFADDGGTMMNALSPANQPDACVTSVLPGRNLALGKPVDVSGALPDQAPEMAVDGDPNTQWSAGGFPTQWIEIDLGGQYSVGEIRMTVGQWPDGEVAHQLWAGSSQETMHLLQEFSGYEYDFDTLSYIPATPLKNIRYIRIVTTESPSWVSWREIEVLAPFPSTPTPTAEAQITATP